MHVDLCMYVCAYIYPIVSAFLENSNTSCSIVKLTYC